MEISSWAAELQTLLGSRMNNFNTIFQLDEQMLVTVVFHIKDMVIYAQNEKGSYGRTWMVDLKTVRSYIRARGLGQYKGKAGRLFEDIWYYWNHAGKISLALLKNIMHKLRNGLCAWQSWTRMHEIGDSWLHVLIASIAIIGQLLICGCMNWWKLTAHVLIVSIAIIEVIMNFCLWGYYSACWL